jgi:hypothetical protein
MEDLIKELKEKVVSGMGYDTISKTKGEQLLEIISQMQVKLFAIPNVSNTFCFTCKHDEIGEDLICVDCNKGDKYKAK